ncbi:5-methyltetrahydropteroyltriglutamate-homocysteine methyltransferase [Cladophialophora psammophila CBS 110553]|uniref:5-methyltetrahydropteroyltriglutamate-homocysteine methyltransferase n=1 Tax=Cladophialophora psammophila CBS 110553 TaxID=1182543 RepID=W9XHP3_9EURO|nr:5-methyltetrahydropteroyltriglutamate-homocysteine methyltransferase [Cladophialophora psammophila CBS 110553]EXJ69869.1 5-methyltetrahydropteroyltriglutamate-homocysteine methyltransferase [Cladophialophora psammophila CBS 110553]
MPLPTGVYRADQVGSLLRPKEILEAREKVVAGELSKSDLRQLEDKYIADVVRKQLNAGLRAITDGEFRRAFFHLDFLQHLDGIEVRGNMMSTNTSKGGFAPPKLVVTGKLGHSKPIQVDDFKFLERQIAEAGGQESFGKVSAKVAIPSPTMVHFRGGRETIDLDAYPSMDVFFDDLARVYQEEIQDLYDAGCRFVQLDDTNLAYLCDPKMRSEAESRHGSDAKQLASQYATLINRAIEKRPRDMTIGIHLCRGNHRSQWFAQGGYEPVAEVLFKDLNVDVYFLEYDDARSGDFSPLRHLPPHKVVVLGIMTSKKGDLDDKAAMIQRLNEAAKYCGKGLDQLCLSHQCGFSSTMEGNELSEEQQWAKIRLEVEIAKAIWGPSTAE